MNKGWFKLHRQLFDHKFWNENRIYSRAEAWIDLIGHSEIEARVVTVKGRDIEIQRGQSVRSNRFLQQRWGWSNSKVDKFLKDLKKMGMIDTKSDSGNTVLSIVKYDTYQDKSDTKKDTKSDTEATPKRQRKEDKEYKNNKNTPKGVSKNATRFVSPTLDETYDFFFEKLKNSKEAKSQSEKFWYYYDSKNWMIGKSKMKKWKSAASGWITRQQDFEKEKKVAPKKEKTNAGILLQRKYGLAE